MEFYTTLPELQKAQQARPDTGSQHYRLRALTPSLTGNQSARNATISVNISAKAQQLVELLELPQGSTDVSTFNLTANTRDILAEIEDKGLVETLQARVDNRV